MRVEAGNQIWSLDDVAQGVAHTLIRWITGYAGTDLWEEMFYADLWYRSARVLVREELARRAATRQPTGV